MHILLLALGVGVLSWLSWISLQSLLQARALRRLSRLPSSAPDERGRQAFYGQVRVTRALAKGFGDLLWCRTQEQVYRRRGKNSGWRTESTVDEWAGFTIDAHGGEVQLAAAPTEVQHTRSHTVTHERTGFFWGHGNGDRRTVYTYLPVVPFASLVGRLAGPSTVGPDNKLGLLLSPHDPDHAASIETWKGVAGLAVVTGAIILGLVIYAGLQS